MTYSQKKQWVKEEIIGKSKKYLERNENGNTIHQNLLYVAKAFLEMMFVKVNEYIKKKKDLK